MWIQANTQVRNGIIMLINRKDNYGKNLILRTPLSSHRYYHPYNIETHMWKGGLFS